MYTICFDLNKTLINENSWRDLNLALGVSEEEDDILMNWGSRGIISDQQGQEILLKIYQESGKHSKENLESILSSYTFKEGAKDLVEYLLEKGHTLLLISGAMDILVERVANELSISYWRANNHFIFDEKGYLKYIETRANDEEAKFIQLTELCEEIGIPVGEVFCVGDGANEKIIFEETGKGITFKGSKLESVAWQVVDSLTDIKELF